MKSRKTLISSVLGLAMLFNSLILEAGGIRLRTDIEPRSDSLTTGSAEQDTVCVPVPERTVLAIKSNLLYDLALMPNLSVELPLGHSFSVLAQSYWPWWLTGDQRYCLQIRSLGFEGRWWFAHRKKEQTGDRKWRDRMAGHFIGIYGISGSSDFQYEDRFCVQSTFWSAGVTYGYSLPVGDWMNLEFSLSAGYARIPWQGYNPSPDWRDLFRDPENYGLLGYIGPTKLEVSLVFPITRKGR